MIAIDDVRRLALALPGALEHQSYGGRPSWRTKPRMFTWVRDEPEALVVWVESEEDKEALIDSEPEKFFTTPHYDGSPIVLVRLAGVDLDEAGELITESWRLRAPKRLVEAFDAEQPDSVSPTASWPQPASREAGPPRRVRQRRGHKLPDGVKSVARPSRWGNPYRMTSEADRAEVLARYETWLTERLGENPGFLDPLEGAQGLACYCPLDVRCHADIIIGALARGRGR